ncbi:serine/threonine-protein kinase, partial [Sphingomonas bacterium]|uniref:serine/threonine-protein kinase n=1 Tax=Sphingomonas bacterium TaxID=1895847 RepID=UPI001575FCE9
LAAAEAAKGFFDLPPRLSGPGLLPDLAPGSRVGSWQIVRAIGRGGMGTVYEAARAEGGFAQRAALKIIAIDASAYLDRFEDERAIVARLEHPGIARLYDGGLDDDGHPFMAMEFVDGTPIVDFARGLPLSRRLQLFLDVCDAVAHAHRNLVVHLDIKPGNVLVTGDGAVRLLDFGAARALTAGLPAGAATPMLTPAYAAPEQLAHAPVTTATDVYSLGVLLRQLVTGELPPGLGAGEHRALRGDLAAIVGKALRADPAERYANADALAADVRSHLRGEPIAIRRDQRLYVAGRLLHRFRWAAAAAALVVAALGVGIVATTIQARRAIAERNHFEAEVARTDAAMDYFALMFHTAAAAGGTSPVTAEQVLQKSVANLDRSFAGDPANYGRVVEFLADLYSEMTDESAGVALETRYLASPAAHADPATASRVRLMLAQSKLRSGDIDDAAGQLAVAQAWWREHAPRYLGELARSRIVEGQIVKARHDIPGAIAVLRLGLAESAAPAAGVPPEDVSNLKNSLALALMANGDFDAADGLMAEVRAYRERQGRTDDNLLTAIQNQGAIALARGDLPRAAGLLRQSIDTRTAVMGPSGALAAAELNLSRTLLLEDKPVEAAAAARDATDVALRYTGPKSALTVGGRVLRAAAAVESRDAAAASLVAAAMAASADKTDPLRALALATEAEQRATTRHSADARTALAAADAMMRSSGRPGLLARPVYDHVRRRALSR